MHVGDAVPLISAQTAMTDALLVISKKGFGVAGVTDGDTLVGVITDGDLRRHMQGLLDLRADQVMTANPLSITSDDLAETALGIMNARKVTTLFVMDSDRPDMPVGILHIHDCLRAGVG